MTAMTTLQRMTAQEFLATTFEQRWVELIGGQVVVNEPRRPHARLHTRLLTSLAVWAGAATGRGEASVPIDVGIDDENVYAPDIVWYAEGRVPDDDDWPYPMPDLAVEIRSPSTWRYDVGTKKSVYEREGLRELWLVDDRAEAVLVFRRSAPKSPAFDVELELARGESLASALLGGFDLPLEALFRR